MTMRDRYINIVFVCSVLPMIFIVAGAFVSGPGGFFLIFIAVIMIICSFVCVGKIIEADARLLRAVRTNDVAMIHKLVMAGADVNSRPSGGNIPSPLFLAAAENNYASVSALVRLGANVNLLNGSGITPLSIAIRVGNTAMVDLLIKSGADVNTIHLDQKAKVLADSDGDISKILKKAGWILPSDLPYF